MPPFIRNMLPFVKKECLTVAIEKPKRDKKDQGVSRRPLRADARRNLDLLLNAAMAVFETSGVNAPIREIAEKAGVGVGTFYRHFPQRSDLILAVLELQINACARAARILSAEYEPDEALLRWMQLYIDLIAKKKGFASALHSGDPAYSGLAKSFLKQMGPALNSLLAAAVTAKAIRPGVPAEDLLRAVVRLCHGPQGEEPAYARSMIQLLLDGMARGHGGSKKVRTVRKS
jgi:AcrR family transcriptional regulator